MNGAYEPTEYRRYQRRYVFMVPESGTTLAEAFGIGERFENSILDLTLPSKLPPITLIVGESGCGKSTLLRALAGNNPEPKLPDRSIPLYEYGPQGTQFTETLNVLSRVGIGDATLFLTDYLGLSDSQQQRARIAHAILHGTNPLVFDEFLATLDRRTAQSVAFCFAKTVRSLGLHAIVATSHDDLEPYLRPDLVIRGEAFPSRWTVGKHDYSALPSNPFVEGSRFEILDHSWYTNESLAHLHYKNAKVNGGRDYWRLVLDGRTVALLVSITRAYDGGRRMARFVVHPTYRGCGLGKHLIARYVAAYPSCDAVAAMGWYTPVFLRAGMVAADPVAIEPPDGLEQLLVTYGFKPAMWSSREYCIEFAKHDGVRSALYRFFETFNARESGHANLYFVLRDGRPKEEVVPEDLNDPYIAGQAIFGNHPKKLARFKGPGGPDNPAALEGIVTNVPHNGSVGVEWS